MNRYRITAIDENYNNSGKIYAAVQILGNSVTFDRPIRELYEQPDLEQFSREDVAYIAALYTAEKTNNPGLIKRFPKHTPAIKDSVIVVGILFTAFLILSNLSAFKIAALGTLLFPAGLIFFPVTYVFEDILTEVYGFKVSRRIIWSALLANLIVFLGAWLTTYLPSAADWHDQTAYALIYRATPRIFVASTIAYFFGGFANSIIIAKLKVLMEGRYLWLRILASTAIGVAIDNILFMHVAFLFVIPYAEVWRMILTVYVIKVIYDSCAMPITYKVANYLKHKDHVDYYDVKTSFNPFSLAI